MGELALCLSQSKGKSSPLQDDALDTLALLADALGERIFLSALTDASKLLDLIFDVELRGVLVGALTELVKRIPTFRKEIQRRLLVRSRVSSVRLNSSAGIFTHHS